MSFKMIAEPRERVGSRASRKLRAAGRIPCTVVADEHATRIFSIDEREFLTARRHHEKLFELEVEGASVPALVRELQWDAFGDRLLHVEFRYVSRTQETEAEVELRYVGHSTEGFLNHLLGHLTVAALPADLPDSLEVDYSGLKAGGFLLAKHIHLPKGVRLVTDPEAAIANLTSGLGEILPSAEETIEAEQAAAAVAQAAAEAAAAKGEE